MRERRKPAHRRLLLAGLALLFGAAAPRPMEAHPLHTSIAELRYDASSRGVQVVIRVFADDLQQAAAADARARAQADPVRAYLLQRFELKGSDGRVIPLQWSGVTHASEDLLLVQLRGAAPSGLRGGSIRNDLIFDLFKDQVNIVKLEVAGRSHTLLFTRGSGSKRLP